MKSLGKNFQAKLLLVEDNANYRKLIKETLSGEIPSLCIKEAADGKEAFQEIASCLPDIIFMDIGLPGENGLVLTKKIKQKYPKIVIVILTAYDLPEYQEAALQNGAQYFLLKNTIISHRIISVVEEWVLSQEKK